MSITVNALERGGYAVWGAGWYDARSNRVMVQAHEDETTALTAYFPWTTISSVVETENGLAGSGPTTSGATLTANLTSAHAGDTIEYKVTLASGDVRLLTLEVVGARRSGDDYGAVT